MSTVPAAQGASSIPDRARVLVIGGGPGGAMTAVLLAREGFDVVVLERATFPRYHIGESLLTSVIPMLEFVGLYERMEQHGFLCKYGGYFVLKKGAAPGHIDFRKVSKHRHSYQVIRSEFDHLVLEYAREMGARVHEATTVTGIEFDDERPIRALWKTERGATGSTAFDYLVDASGLSGLMATRYLRNRRVQEAFANVALGSYWKDHQPYRAPDGTPQGGDFFMEALEDGAGWVWAIPLHDQRLSVGIVVHVNEFRRMRAGGSDLEGVYRKGLSRCPIVREMLADARRVDTVRSWQDYSYIADAFSGPSFRLVGDAAAFIDPLFSTGVHLAFFGALSAAATIASVLRGETTESQAADFHDKCIRKAYVRFAIIVTGMYRQIRNQELLVPYGLDGGDFRRAFEAILPVVSGAAELDHAVPTETLDRTVAFMMDMMNERAQLGSDNAAARLFLERAGVHEDLASDPSLAIDGWYIRMARGRLGLAAVTEDEERATRRKLETLKDALGKAAGPVGVKELAVDR